MPSFAAAALSPPDVARCNARSVGRNFICRVDSREGREQGPGSHVCTKQYIQNRNHRADTTCFRYKKHGIFPCVARPGAKARGWSGRAGRKAEEEVVVVVWKICS